jgi:hypothetical protein
MNIIHNYIKFDYFSLLQEINLNSITPQWICYGGLERWGVNKLRKTELVLKRLHQMHQPILKRDTFVFVLHFTLIKNVYH